MMCCRTEESLVDGEGIFVVCMKEKLGSMEIYTLKGSQDETRAERGGEAIPDSSLSLFF